MAPLDENNRGLRSSEGLELQYTGRFTLEVRWGTRRKSFDVEGLARPDDFVPSHFERWDNSTVANDIAEQTRILTAFQSALALLNEAPRNEAPGPKGARGSAQPSDGMVRALRAVKIVHTLVWAIFAGCIVALPVAAYFKDFRLAAILIAIVLVEVVVLVANRFRCPLTGVAARFTSDRRANFDIYLPLCIARYNKEIFGSLFVAGLLFTLAQWRFT